MSDQSLDGEDYVIEAAPSWVPTFLAAVLEDLTYNEVHAAELGLAGFLAGFGVHLGYSQEVGALSLALVGTAFGLRRLPETGQVSGRVIRREPWYFLVVYVATAALAMWTAPIIL